MVLVNRTYIGLIHINYPSEVCSLSSESLVKWTYQKMRRKLFLLICKEKHSILSFPVILEKRNLDYNPVKQKTQKYFHLKGVTSFQIVLQLQKEILLQECISVSYSQFTELITGNYSYNDKIYRFLAIKNFNLQSRYTSTINSFMVGNQSDHTWSGSDILDQEGKKQLHL